MPLMLCNNFATTLSAAITTTGQTSITVTSATGLPTLTAVDWCYLTLSDGAVNNPETTWEVVKVTAIVGTTLTIVRGQDNTSALTWANGAYIQARPCVQELRDLGGIQRIGVGDANYTVTTTSSAIVDFGTTLTAARTCYLPAATQAGQIIWVVDSSGSANNSNSITIVRATSPGTDTIEGTNTNVVLNSPFMATCLNSNGAGKWIIMTYEEIPLVMSNADVTITNREDVIVLSTTTLSANRALNLPSAITVGQRVAFIDFTGNAGTYTVNITRAVSPGTDTINGVAGPYSIPIAYGYAELVCSGVGKWQCTQQPMIASGGSLSTTGAYAINLTATGATGVTLPTSGTLVALGGTNTWSATQTFSVVSTFTQGFTCTAYAGGTTAGQMWYDSTQFSMAAYLSGTKTMLSGTIWTKTSSTALATWTTAATLIGAVGTGIGTLTVGAGRLAVGTTIRVTMKGVFGTYSTAPTFTFALTLGGVSVCTTGAVTSTLSLTSKGWNAEFLVTCRTTGSSGTVFGQGFIFMNTGVVTTCFLPTNTTATATVNTTGALAVDVTCACGTSNGSNTVTCTNATVEILN